MKYTTIDKNGVPTAFYSDDVHKVEDMPSDAISITDKVWQELLDGQGSKMWDTKAKSVKSYTHVPTSDEIDAQLSAEKARTKESLINQEMRKMAELNIADSLAKIEAVTTSSSLAKIKL